MDKDELIQSEVYAFMYCPCIHESAFATVSLHKTEKGAEMAMAFDKEAKRKEHDKMYSNLSISEVSELYSEFGIHEAWSVAKLPILE